MYLFLSLYHVHFAINKERCDLPKPRTLALFQCFLICLGTGGAWGHGGVVSQLQRGPVLLCGYSMGGVMQWGLFGSLWSSFPDAGHFLCRSPLVDRSLSSHSWEIKKKITHLVNYRLSSKLCAHFWVGLLLEFHLPHPPRPSEESPFSFLMGLYTKVYILHWNCWTPIWFDFVTHGRDKWESRSTRLLCALPDHRIPCFTFSLSYTLCSQHQNLSLCLKNSRKAFPAGSSHISAVFLSPEFTQAEVSAPSSVLQWSQQVTV